MPKTKPQPAASESSTGNPHSPPLSRPLRFKVLGLGGAGIKTLALLKTIPFKDAELIAVDTDLKNLPSSPETHSIRIGELVTRGLSTGGDAALGSQAAEEEGQRLREAVGGAKLIFILAGLGGGTGSGAAPVVAQLAQQTGALTVAVTFLPFEFEAAARRAIAKENADALRSVCDATLCIPQDPLLEGSDSNPEQAFRSAEALAAQMIGALVALVTARGMGEISLQDLRKAWGSCRSELAFGMGTAENSVTTAWEQALRMPTCAEETLVQANQIFVAVRGTDLRIADTMKLTERLHQDYPHARVTLFANPEECEQTSVTIFATRPVAKTEEPATNPTPLPARSTRPRQQTLNLEPPSRGRFEKTEHTIYNGEDLDLPTYMRKNVRLR